MRDIVFPLLLLQVGFLGLHHKKMPKGYLLEFMILRDVSVDLGRFFVVGRNPG